MSKRVNVKPARRRSRAKGFPWWPSAIGAGILVAVAAFVLVTHVGSSPGSSTSGASQERGLPIGAEAPSQSLQSTDSNSMFVVDANGRVAWKKLAADTMHVSVDEVVNAVKAA